MKINLIIFFISLLFVSEGFSDTPAEKPTATWMNINGNWTITNGKLAQMQPRSIRWEYHELMNYNTVVTINPVAQFSELSFTSKIYNPGQDMTAEFMVPFAVTSPKQHYYYNFLAFKFAGDEKKISRISLIKSERKDPSKPFTEKNNFTITEIASARCNIPYCKRLKCSITFSDGSAILKVNRKKMLEAPIPADHSGKVGFAARNIRISIDDVKVLKGDEILLSDDFSSDTLYVPTVKIKRTRE